MLQLPKLTRSLRAFTKLEGDPVQIETNDIIAKQKEYTDKIREYDTIYKTFEI